MNKNLIPLNKLYINMHSRNRWCKLPYPDHPHGCPYYPKCHQNIPVFTCQHEQSFKWYAIILEYNQNDKIKRLQRNHPDWSHDLIMNHLEKNIIKQLKRKAIVNSNRWQGDIILERPEASGINVMLTLFNENIVIEPFDTNNVKRFMFIGKPKKVVKK